MWNILLSAGVTVYALVGVVFRKADTDKWLASCLFLFCDNQNFFAINSLLEYKHRKSRQEKGLTLKRSYKNIMSDNILHFFRQWQDAFYQNFDFVAPL